MPSDSPLQVAARHVALVGVPTSGLPAFLLTRILTRLGVTIADFTATPDTARVIVALGADALDDRVGFSNIRRYRGYILRDLRRGIPVIGTFHPLSLFPSRLLTTDAQDKNPWRFVAAVILDIRKALELASADTPYVWERPNYLCDPDLGAFARFAQEYEDAGCPLLSIDIETPGKLVESSDEDDTSDEIASTTILRIGFCWTPGYAASVPWRGDYEPVIRRLLATPGPKLGWNNYNFDNVVLAQHHALPAGVQHDGSWAWHLLQSDLPRGLEFVGGFYATGLTPWKHLGGSEPAWYNAQDTDVALRNFLGIEADLRTLAQWDLYAQHIVALDPVLREAAARGVPLDRTAQDALRVELAAIEAALLVEIQALAGTAYSARKRYKKRPDDAARLFEAVIVPGLVKACSVCGAQGITKGTHLTKGGKKNPCAAAGATVVLVAVPCTEWDEILPFNPLGGDLERYVKAHGHPMGRHAKSGAPTLDKKAIQALVKKHGAAHPLYAKTLDLRQASKVSGTFLFPAGRDGRIHTEYSYAPTSGRLSSRRPNLQNVTHGGSNPYADKVRRTIVPPPGHLFVEADSSAIEAVFSGLFMGSASYTALARQGVHDYVTCLELGQPFDAAALGTYKQDPVYAEARERNKRVVHGTNYGMTPNLMIKLFPEIFPTLRVAREAQARYFEACPELATWHQQVRETAHRQGYLENPWKRRHYFWRVFGKDPHTGTVTVGEDGKRCVSFLPQSSAADFMLDHLLHLGESPWRTAMPANVSVHDSICLMVPEAQVDAAVDYLCTLMFREIPQMGGLRVGVECKVGPNWADMKVVRKVQP